jgi:stage III sporulation protein AG
MTATYESDAGRCVKSMKKSGKLAVALIGVLIGASLLLFGNRLGGSKDNTAAPEAPTAVSARSAEEYRAELEARMEEICRQVAGVGEVDVAVTLDGGFSYVYATDKKTTVGGESLTYVTVGSGDGETLVYLSEKAPAVVGIGVVCTGGMDPTVRREVTSLLSAAFGVGSNKIYVTGRK